MTKPPCPAPLKLGLVGAGNIARMHLQALALVPEARAVAIHSRTFERAGALAAEFGIPRVAGSLAELARPADPELAPDALMVLVSADQMAAQALACMDFGLPLFLEKPVGLSVEEAEAAAQKAARLALPNMVGYNRRHYSIFKKGLTAVLERGPLLAVHVEGNERMAQVRSVPRFSETTLRGWIFANATHTIDLLRHFGGEIDQFCAFASSLREPLGDQFCASMRFAGGALGSYTGHWHSPGGWAVVLKGVGITAEFRPLETCRLTLADGTQQTLEPDAEDVSGKPGFAAQLRAFAALARTGELAPPCQDLSGALATMRLAGQLCAAPRPIGPALP